ncbi:MAG: hypothetical protein JWM80_5605 [Cyanobacteria bacterium RYN_339]|nr:hypothetical protein [Cyanobacteria bacterium RYN_339]
MENWSLPTGLTSALRLLTWQGSTQAPPPPAPTPPAMSQDALVLSPKPPAPAPKPVPKAKPAPAPTPARGPVATAGQIALNDAKGQYIKDPSFANNGQPIGNQRYIAFGNLRKFYLKGFELGKSADGAPGLAFNKGEIPIDIKGLAPGLDGLWAPQVVVTGDTVRLYYTAGKMGFGIDWPSFRLHEATVSLKDFRAAAEAGKPVSFQDKGTLFNDQQTFGGNDRDFAMIDPQFYKSPNGKAYMTYTVVKAGIPGKRSHEEFVRSREVDPNNPGRAVGPDKALVDGWAGGRHDGVAEAQDLVTYNGRPYLFVSSRGGDKDQRVLVAPVGADLGPVPDNAWREVLTPGGAPWSSNAVGSTSGAVMGGKLFTIYQGMDANHQFSLGFKPLSI